MWSTRDLGVSSKILVEHGVKFRVVYTAAAVRAPVAGSDMVLLPTWLFVLQCSPTPGF